MNDIQKKIWREILIMILLVFDIIFGSFIVLIEFGFEGRTLSYIWGVVIGICIFNILPYYYKKIGALAKQGDEA